MLLIYYICFTTIVFFIAYYLLFLILFIEKMEGKNGRKKTVTKVNKNMSCQTARKSQNVSLLEQTLKLSTSMKAFC